MTRDLPHGVRPAPRRKAAARTARRPREAGEADRVVTILARLAERDPDPKAGFDRTDPFRLLVTVLLSAQSTGPTVSRIAEALFSEARDPAGMAALGEARITEIVRPVGLGPSKARNIVKLSAVLLAEHGGAVPCSAAEMRRLPGIGRKSAEVTANFAFHEPVIAVDTHIFRISNRIPLAPGPTVDAVADGLARIVPDAFKDNAHVWLFRHGRDICTARNPACPRCPVSDLCAWPSKATA
ncbi:endonuclease III domain-containing protein [Methylobacterium radiotolerans]|jgi:endonuclease-3|uniref:endonuclease III domain-containing protein n=1 Tax=Methylobacterium TaxID=407 RepID=UPI0005E5290B|nr:MULTISPECIES: endonuclease III [Methylobacterium]MBN6824464.1 endonuclease III [Methylobacterium organophilum]OXE41804.1 endonuclease III [Methylobacterium radiotolerans]GAN52522.1 DNA-(apurinic or apyrimidinic site) lyase [Methylobacterium sp. ME121]